MLCNNTTNLGSNVLLNKGTKREHNFWQLVANEKAFPNYVPAVDCEQWKFIIFHQFELWSPAAPDPGQSQFDKSDAKNSWFVARESLFL